MLTYDELLNKYGKIGRYDNVAEPFHCDVNHKLFMGHLGNHLLNAADFHSTEREFGMRYLNTIHKTWVLSRLVIEMEKMPQQYERFAVETWVESALRYFTNRNFRIAGANDETLGYGRSVWALIDTESRQPQNIFDIRNGEIANWVLADKECPIAKPSRVRMTKEAELAGSIVARYNDIDVNGHVNSVKYIEHVLDLFPLDVYREKMLKRFEIAYVSESHHGDKLSFYKQQMGENEYEVRITKLCDDGSETECCRSMLLFV